MKKQLVVILAIAIAFGPVNGALAVENGISAAGDPHIVSLYRGSSALGSISVEHPMCSAYLITNRIVVTAQHCTMHPKKEEPSAASELLIGLPGEKSNLSAGHHYAVAAVFRAENYKKSDLKTDLSYTNDVALLVLEKAIPNVPNVKLLNREEFSALVLQNPEVWIGGYGLQSFAQRSIANNKRFISPVKAPARFADPVAFQSAVAARKSSWGRSFYQETLVGLQMATSTGTICDGDSGSGFWLKQKSQTIYLGNSNGPVDITNCQGKPAEREITYIGVHPTYLYQSLFDSAKEFVAANPAKSTITCKKGKLTKKVTALKPKCPTGYKTL